MAIAEINKRYSLLAEDSCCLSCGGAINHSKINPGDICVDLGSGRGTDAMRMAEKCAPTGMAYGIDISDGMIEKATKNAQKLGIENIEFKKAALENLPLDNNSVDIIISNCTINHATNKQQVWNEIYRALKPGGRFVVSDIYATTPVPAMYKSNAEAIAECWAGADTREVYLQTLANAGFTAVNIIEESVPYAKGEIEVCSFTIAAFKPQKTCCCS
ncbi:MAG: methyltransferase domain-containing protein [Bacteroidales bacterium]|nr:methyltransferase domain-containing protein [Bacteroidales bacterium]